MADALHFPPGFVWGVSSSAHQFEGDNRNNWSEWEERGRIHTGERCGRACNWWKDAESDFDLARDMGLGALRISVEWSRIEPEEGRFDDAALARYRAMVGAIASRGMRPWICLHHFTNPLWFERRGAFLDPEAPRLFARFARRVVEALGDACSDWLTFNEPNVYATAGYLLGEFPPGRRGDALAVVRVQMALLRAHAAAYRALHATRSGLSVGFTQNLFTFEPASARSRLDRIATRIPEVAYNRAFVHALEHGRLPGVLAAAGRVDEARGTFDFVGFNYYGRFLVAFDARRPLDLFHRRLVPEGVPRGDAGHSGNYPECHPPGLALHAERLARLGKPVYVLENGVPDAADSVRPWLVARAAHALHAAIARGVDVRGYFHWALVDNFEWAEGWRLRFGLVEMDEKTQARRMRASGHLYAAIARSNALHADDVARFAPGALDEV